MSEPSIFFKTKSMYSSGILGSFVDEPDINISLSETTSSVCFSTSRDYIYAGTYLVIFHIRVNNIGNERLLVVIGKSLNSSNPLNGTSIW